MLGKESERLETWKDKKPPEEKSNKSSAITIMAIPRKNMENTPNRITQGIPVWRLETLNNFASFETTVVTKTDAS